MTASIATRLRGISGIRLNAADTVIATVALSAVMASATGIVVASNVYQALQSRLDVAAVENDAQRQPALAEAEEDAAPQPRRYPEPDLSLVFAGVPSFEDPMPRLRTPSQLSPHEIEILSRPVLPTVPDAPSRPVDLAPVVQALQAPIARPDIPATRTDPVESAAIVVASPRPASRPASIVAVAASTRAIPAVEVARAAAPEAAIQPARVPTARGGLFAPRAGSNPCSGQLARGIPRRPGNAAEGSAILASVGNGSGSGRDTAIIAEAMRGNVPSHMRDLVPVRFQGNVGGRATEVVICVTPDYLAVGSDRDHVRVPLGLPAALRVADAFDMMLPTTRMVDAIYAQADLRLSPRPMTPGPQMSSTDYFRRHDATLDSQMAEAGGRHGLLIAGHKKDVVIANRLARARGRVAIYGWHRSNGDPIQPLSTVHGAYYADYSHGIRLVSRTAFVDGRAVDLRALLTDGSYAGLLNSDGVLSSATVQLASL